MWNITGIGGTRIVVLELASGGAAHINCAAVTHVTSAGDPTQYLIHLLSSGRVDVRHPGGLEGISQAIWPSLNHKNCGKKQK